MHAQLYKYRILYNIYASVTAGTVKLDTDKNVTPV